MSRATPRDRSTARGRTQLVVGIFVALAACKSREEHEARTPTLPVELAKDARATPDAETEAWSELAKLPRAEPLRVITIPTRQDVPRFDVGGPAIAGDLAVVASSQFGFAAVDWRRGTLAWTKPAGSKIAPPLATDTSFILIGACLTPPEVPADHTLLGCLRVVTATGADQAYVAIHGRTAAVETFAGTPGTQETWLEGDRVRWRRGEAAVVVDLMSGVATPATTLVPPVVVDFKDRRWEITHDDGKLVALQVTNGRRRPAWRTQHEVTALLGSVWLPDQTPLIRTANISAYDGTPAIRLLDIDATGSMNGTASWTSVPGISLLGQAISPVGDVALAVRMDKSIKHDFIAAYAANALLIYVYPLPRVMRPDPVGVAIALDADRAPEAVIAFHDGDLVTVLPTLSSPPTAPGAAQGPLKKPTP